MFKPIREVKTSKMVSKNNLSFQNYKKYNTNKKNKIKEITRITLLSEYRIKYK
tara:strand:- start:28 stop:186 length:159 start_codon:yes stop_codon:yes gene_type:complete